VLLNEFPDVFAKKAYHRHVNSSDVKFNHDRLLHLLIGSNYPLGTRIIQCDKQASEWFPS